MLPSQRSRLCAVWQALEAGEAYVLIDDYRYYTESPEEAMDRDHDERESVLRVFLTEDDAEIYRTQVCESRSISPTSTFVLKLCLDDLFSMLRTVRQRVETEHNAPLRVDVCSIQEDEWPRVIDVLKSDFVDMQ